MISQQRDGMFMLCITKVLITNDSIWLYFFQWKLYYFLNQIYLNVTSGAMHGMFMFFTFFIYIKLVLYNQPEVYLMHKYECMWVKQAFL